MNLAKVFGDCIEWAEATCDTEFTVDEFFAMVDIPAKNRNDYAYASLLGHLGRSGFFENS